jgi:hypothetical protein
MPNPDLDARLHLLHHNREGIMVMLQRTVAAGKDIEDSVVVLADTRDSVGGALARALAEKHPGLDADAEAARAEGRGEIPTLVAVVTVMAAVDVFAIPNPGVSAGLRRPIGQGHVRVVVVGAGGSTLLGVPVERLAGGGSA